MIKMDLVSLGNFLKETIINKDGSRQYVLGGPSAYTTICAARLGARTGIVSRVGFDMNADQLKSFSEAGVDQRGLDRDTPWTTTNELGYDDEGRKRILRYKHIAATINQDVIPDDYYGSKVFYVCGSNRDVELPLLKRLRNQAGLMAVDLTGMGGSGRSLQQNSWYKKDPQAFRHYLSYFDVVKASEDDCELITCQGKNSILPLIDEVLCSGPSIVLLTLGERGTEIHTNDGVQKIKAHAKAANVIDTTGAGDCYTAGFFFRYCQSTDKNLSAAVRFGSAVAHHVIQRTGGVKVDRMPSYSQIKTALLDE